MWFAFKLYLYRVLSHPVAWFTFAEYGCDLLSNCIFIEFYHIGATVTVPIQEVVICFQIVSLSSSITSGGHFIKVFEALWFAFKLYLYRVLSHHLQNTTTPPLVVICFQIVSLSSSITSFIASLCHPKRLWFAFKLYLYRVLSHHPFRKPIGHRSCDLLSNCIFIEFYHITIGGSWRPLFVVICFQIVSLSSSITSMKSGMTGTWTLWFAFKLYLYRVLSHPAINFV